MLVRGVNCGARFVVVLAVHLGAVISLQPKVSFSWTLDTNAAKLGTDAEAWLARFRNDPGQSISRMESAVSRSWVSFFLCGHACLAVWDGDEFCGRDLVRIGRNPLHSEGQPDCNPSDAARSGGSSVRWSADRSSRPALSW